MFQIVAGANSEFNILLYGDVGKWDSVRAKDIISLLEKAKSDGAKKINLRVHSGGGSVFEAFAIYDAIKNIGVDTVAYIDGVAASMASIIVQGAKEVYASKMARVMTHQSRAMGVSGTANQLRNIAGQLETINEQFADIYAEKTGKDKKWITQNWLPEGRDVWFTAQQAKDAGLINGLVEPPQNLAPVKAENDVEIVAHYDNYFNNLKFVQSEGAKPSQPITKMDTIQVPKSKILALLDLLGVKQAVQASLNDADVFGFLQETVAAFSGKIAELQTLEAKIAETEKAQIIDAVKLRGGDLQMQNDFIAKYNQFGFEATLSILEYIPKIKDLTAVRGSGAEGVQAGGRDWVNVQAKSIQGGLTWQEMANQNPTEYAALAEQNPALFATFVATEGMRL